MINRVAVRRGDDEGWMKVENSRFLAVEIGHVTESTENAYRVSGWNIEYSVLSWWGHICQWIY
jgi:hypothetical protein